MTMHRASARPLPTTPCLRSRQVLLVATAIAGMVFGADAVSGEIVGQLDQLVGREGARAVQSLLEGASQRRGGIIATVVGSIAFVVAATGAFLELQAALNTIWRVKPNPGLNLRAFVFDRLRSFGLVVAIGFLLMVSLAVTAALAALSGWLSARATSMPLVWSGITVLVSLIVTTALFALLYRVLPDVHLRWRDVTTGAFVTAVLFTIGQQLIGLYLGQSSVASSYGATGSVMILLLWVYYSCQILLLGAEFTRAYAMREGTQPAPESFAERDLVAPSGSPSRSPADVSARKRSVGGTFIVAVVALVGCSSNVDNQPHGQAAVPGAEYKNAEYVIEGQRIRLADGLAEAETSPGSASRIVTRYFGNELRTDLNDDGREDVVFVLTQQRSGSGTFFYAVAALNTEAGYVGSDGYLLGDRIVPHTTVESRNPRHKNVIVVNYGDRRPGEPMTAQPSVGKSLHLKLDAETVRWGIVVPGFEGESR